MPVFTAVRAICAAIIVFHHGYINNWKGMLLLTKQYPNLEYLFRHIVMRGFVAADIFFLISGWLNAQSLFNSLRSERFVPLFLKFMIKRFFRIAPIYYLVLLIVYVFFDNLKFTDLIAHIFFVGNWQLYSLGSLWYVNV
jgi:peptidoglycan/LPS O-acetylase OafA/YrhL